MNAQPTLTLNDLIQEGRMEIGPDLADRFLTEARYPRQRNLRAGQVALLSNKLLRGTFHGSGQISFAVLGERVFLVNGQHRLTAVSQTRIPADFHVSIENVEDENELHALYWTFDRHTAQRTTADVLTASGIAGQMGITNRVAAAAWNAMSIIMTRFSKSNNQADTAALRDDDARLKEASRWWDISRQYEEIVGHAQSNLRSRLLGAQVMAVALVTLKHQPERAKEFWEGLAKNDGLRAGDPRRPLLDILFDREKKRRTGSNTQRAGYVAAAWNKFLAGQTCQQLRVYEDRPIVIDGTPYSGR